MAKVTVELDSEQIDLIMVQDLKWQLSSLKNSLKKDRPLIFETDPVEDKKKIKEMISAMKMVLSWYGIKK